MNTRSDTSRNPQSICRNPLASALRAWGWGFLSSVVALGGFVAIGGEEDNLKTGPSLLAPQPGNLQAWTAARDARIAEKRQFLAKMPAAPAGADVTSETALVPLGATPKYSSSTGVENFEAAWPDSYWTVTGWPTWNDVNCITPYEGSWSAYCAGSSSSCAGYYNNMDAVMYTECQYAGTVSQGNNKLYYRLNIPSIESCCDYLEIKFEGYISQPPHGAGTPTVTGSARWTSATSGWEGWNTTLNSAFDPCNYVRVSFRFHSDISNTGQGAYLDYIEFNNRTDTDIYPILGGFNPNPCTYSISPTSGSIAACGGSTSVSVSAGSGCSWTASNPCSSWLTMSPSSGSGSGTVTLSASANNSGSSRSCTLTIAGTSYTVTQPSASIAFWDAWWSNITDIDGDGCPEGVARLNWDADYSCSGSVSVFANVYYKASTDSTWILSDASPCYTITGAIGSDVQYMDFLMWDGTWDYAIDLLYCGESTVQDTFYLLGHCEESCGYLISPTSWSPSASSGGQVVTVTATAGCAWSVSNPCTSWLTVSPMNGIGSGSVTVTAQANTSCNPRSCTMAIGGRTYTVNQAAGSGTFTISPTSWSPSANSGSQVVTVTAAAGCSWSVSNPCTSWLTVSPASGTGSGSVTVTVQANASCSTRTCSMAIAGNTFTVNQAAGSGTFTISPTSWSPSASSGSQVVTVTAAAGCSWSVSNPCTSWLTVATMSGTGSGVVTVTAGANTSCSTRTCSVSIAGNTFTINQAAGSGTFTISPTGWSAPGGGGSQVVTVTAAAGCSWSVGNPCTSWLTASPASGTGNGSVTVTAIANSTPNTRSCTVTIAGQVFSVTQPTVAPYFVTRQLPAGYTPGVSLTLTEAAVPSQNTSVYAVEDLPPAGWVVGTISDGGTVDVNGKVKWGPFFDNAARSLTCQLTPPIGPTNRAFFSGTGSADGVNCSIGGSNYLDAIVVVAHPADGPCAGDMYMRIGEVTAYGAAWKNGTTWACQPNPIPISYVTRCGYLWKNGEHYCSDPLQAAPLCWYNCAKGAGVEGDKGASIVTSSINGCTVCLTATPDATTGVYAVEDTVPAGCTVSGITQNGSFDAVNHKIKWGPYFDNTPRTLCYTLSAGCSGTLSGLGSFDGVDVTVSGQRQSCGARPVLLSMDIYPGVTLTGTVGQTYRVEWSPLASGGTWTPVATVLLTNTTQLCVDTSSPCRTNRFYRAVQMP